VPVEKIGIKYFPLNVLIPPWQALNRGEIGNLPKTARQKMADKPLAEIGKEVMPRRGGLLNFET